MDILLHILLLGLLVVIVFIIVKVLTSLVEAIRMASHHKMLRKYDLDDDEITEMIIKISEGYGEFVAIRLRDYDVPEEVIKVVTGF